MATALIKNCHNNVLELQQKRSREQGKAALLDRVTKMYRNSGYKWGYYATREDPAHDGDVDEHWAILELGQDWGVLRGVNTAIDFSKVQFHLPDGPQIAHTIMSTCKECDGGEIKIFKEEVEYVQDKLPFNCVHGRKINDFQPGSTADGPISRHSSARLSPGAQHGRLCRQRGNSADGPAEGAAHPAAGHCQA